MKTGIHPQYHSVTVTCTSCGTAHHTASTTGDYSVEVCSNCHPFYTGKSRVLDTAGRVERFNKRYGRRA